MGWGQQNKIKLLTQSSLVVMFHKASNFLICFLKFWKR